MPRWLRMVIVLAAYIVFGLALPFGVLAWLLIHYEHAYVVDARALAERASAFPPHGTLQHVYGALNAGRGATALYSDTSIVTIVTEVASPETTIEAYAAQLHPVVSTSTSVSGYTTRDMRLPSGRVARAYGIGDTVLAFVAANPAALDALVARTPALKRNTRRGAGNVVFDEHRVSAILIGAGWLAVWTIVTGIVTMRLALPRPTAPPSGAPAVEPEELGRRLLALGDGTHPFTVTASAHPGEYFVDWRYDDTWNTFFAHDRMRKLVRIRLRFDPATRTVDSTDFESEFDSSFGGTPDPFGSVSWRFSRGYTFVEKEVYFGGGKSYRFDIADMRRPVVATITGAGWTYRPQL